MSLLGIEPAWKRCRPGNELKVYHVSIFENGQSDGQATNEGFARIRTETCSEGEYPSLSSSNLNITVVPIVTGSPGSVSGVGTGRLLTLQRLFRDCKIPESALSAFLDNQIHFARFPVPATQRTLYQLCLRQWALCWTTDEAVQRTHGILLWLAGSWSQSIAEAVDVALRSMDPFPDPSLAPGLLASILCLRHLSKSIADNDEEAFSTECRLREVIHAKDTVKYDEEVRRLPAAHSWLGSRALRDHTRIQTTQNFLNYAKQHYDKSSKNDAHVHRAVKDERDCLIEPLQMIAESLVVQTLKLYEESTMHMSILHNLTAQRDQSLNLMIAAASREIALQSKLDQTISLEITESSKQIAEESKRDGTAMKIIAVMTMLYLPATFIASCFSMPLFQWTAASSEVVNPRIWIFFAISTALTMLTVVAFAAWLHLKDRRTRLSPQVPQLRKAPGQSASRTGAVTGAEFQESLKPNSSHESYVEGDEYALKLPPEKALNPSHAERKSEIRDPMASTVAERFSSLGLAKAALNLDTTQQVRDFSRSRGRRLPIERTGRNPSYTYKHSVSNSRSRSRSRIRRSSCARPSRYRFSRSRSRSRSCPRPRRTSPARVPIERMRKQYSSASISRLHSCSR